MDEFQKLPWTDGRAPHIFDGVIQACKFCSVRLLRLAARVLAYRDLRLKPQSPPSQSSVDLTCLADNLRKLAHADFELDGDEGSLERGDEWARFGFVEHANTLAHKVCNIHKTATEKARLLNKWPRLQLQILEELNAFDYASFNLVSRFPDQHDFREFMKEGLDDPEVVAWMATQNDPPTMPIVPAKPALDPPKVCTTKDNRNRFMYGLAMREDQTWDQIRIATEREFPDKTPTTPNGVKAAIKAFCTRQNLPEPPPRKHDPQKQGNTESN